MGLIVEGQGDELALPALLRRVFAAIGVYDVVLSRPFRVKRGRFASGFDDFARALKYLARDNDMVLVVLDSDDDCPVDLASNLLGRAHEVHLETSLEVVVANKEFESWFLASVESLRGYRGVSHDAVCPDDVEAIRGAKGKFERMIDPPVYSETVDQVKFACRMDLEMARANSPSFDKFWRSVVTLTF